MRKFHVIFQPSGSRGSVSEGETLLEASRELGVEIESLCGGAVVCGKCKIRLETDSFQRYGITSRTEHLSPFTEDEGKFISEREQGEGYRLSCSARVLGDVLISVPEESRASKQVVRKAAARKSIEVKPAVSLYHLELPPPTFQDLMGDFDRLHKALKDHYRLPPLEVDHLVLQKLPVVLRQGDWKVTVAVWMDKRIVDVRPGHVNDLYGLAVDIGTTTVAAYLCNLQNGDLIATETMMNPQVIYGEDVMSRITYVSTAPEGLDRMHRAIIDGLNRLIEAVTSSAGMTPEAILEITFVGNTAMHHFLLKIHPEYLGLSPFPPAIHRSVNVLARDLGLKAHPSANVHVLPIEAGFVGADNVGVLIAEEPYRQDKNILIIDIGTNGELVLGNHRKLVSSSCATGPALEGAHIKHGMRAVPGAIERIRINPDTFDVQFKVVGREDWSMDATTLEAKGICGSGIIDAIAELYRTGLIDKSGRFRVDVPSPRLRAPDGIPEFVISWGKETTTGKDITITQQDVRNVQLAKGAIHAGAKLMMKRMGIRKLDKVILAGAFGSTIDVEEALVMGMFPDCDLKKIIAVGNAAGDGARIALLNRDKRVEADEIARKVEYLELTIDPDFQKEFMDAMAFPHGRDSFPHLKGIVKDKILNQ
jgi:uncharacterized 2Fe-2S/4Fe-4S cluster protein (DUF4445 family)